MKSFNEAFYAVIAGLNAEAQHFFYDHTKVKSFGRGDYLLQAGEVCRFTFLVEEGIARRFYLKEGIEITTEFVFAGEMITAVASFLQQEPGYEYIQTIDACRIRLLPYDLFHSMHSRYPDVAQIDFMVLQQQCIWFEKRLFDLQFRSAAEKYATLMDNHPQLIQMIPLGYLASYLGITQETLSRMRAKII